MTNLIILLAVYVFIALGRGSQNKITIWLNFTKSQMLNIIMHAYIAFRGRESKIVKQDCSFSQRN